MPLLSHLKRGYEDSQQPAWHRNQERQIRGLAPIKSHVDALEDWEVDLVFTETLALSGTSQMSFKYLAYAWGKEKGFHANLTHSLCGKKASLQNAAAALGKDDTAARPYFEAKQGHYGMHSADYRANSQLRRQAYKNLASTVSLTADESDSTTATKASGSRYPMHRSEAHSTSSSSSFMPPNHFHRQSNSLTLECEVWNAGTMVRYHELDFAQNGQQQASSSAGHMPRCDSPLQLDQKLLDDIYESEQL